MQKVGGKWYGFNRGLSTLFAEVENRRGRARRALSPPAHHAWAEFGGCGVEKPHSENVRLLSPQTFALSCLSTASGRDRWHGCRSQPCKKVPRRSPATCPTTSPALRTREPRPFARWAPRGRCTTAQWAVSERRESRKLGAPAADTGLCARRVGCGHQPPDSATPPPNHQCPPPQQRIGQASGTLALGGQWAGQRSL